MNLREVSNQAVRREEFQVDGSAQDGRQAAFHRHRHVRSEKNAIWDAIKTVPDCATGVGRHQSRA